MATTAAAYGCSAALPFAAFPSSPSARRASPSRVSLASSSSSMLRAPSPGCAPWLASSRAGLSSAMPKLVCSPCRLRVSYRRRELSVSACSGEVESDAAALPAEPTFDIKLPRRSLLVQFTCNKCGERTKRLINRVAYERGTVFLQCAGCQVYHKFVDNLGLVVEYDLRNENGVNTYTED